MRILLVLFLLVAVLGGCSTVPKDYTKFKSADPHSILVVPVVNKSVDVTASDFFLATISLPIAERGYYVFPVHLVKRLLEDDGLSDANMVHSANPSRLCDIFGSDSVLYVTIDRWDSQYLVLTTTVTVEFTYMLKDGKTGETLWEEKKKMVYQPSSNNSPLAAIVSAALTKASPNYMPLTRQANKQVFAYPGPGIPAGPYRDEYGKDLALK